MHSELSKRDDQADTSILVVDEGEAARRVALVDLYDALTHDRVYRPAMSEERALAIMQVGSGTHFDPCLFSVFVGLVPELRRIAQENPEEHSHQKQFLPGGVAVALSGDAPQSVGTV